MKNPTSQMDKRQEPRRGLSIVCALLLLMLLLSATGCGHYSGLFWKDPVSGKWSGEWFLANSPKPGGKLMCDVTRTGKNEWKAVFDAEFGGRAIYKVELTGHREGEKVAFGGDVDLGAASGGVFNWKGEADGKKFTGKYTSKTYGGHFEMDRVADPPAAQK